MHIEIEDEPELDAFNDGWGQEEIDIDLDIQIDEHNEQLQ
jgi:hypothetical protein